MKISKLHFYTINSGDMTTIRKENIEPFVIDLLSQYINQKEFFIPGLSTATRYLVKLDTDRENKTAIFTVYRAASDEPTPLSINIVTVLENKTEILDIVFDFYEKIYIEDPPCSKYQLEKDTAPCLYTTLFLFLLPGEAEWLADFEKCLAWTVIEKVF